MFSLICAWTNGWVKQSRRRWFETPSGWLWRHCNVEILARNNGKFALLSFNYGLSNFNNFSTCHDNTTVVSCAKYCSDHFDGIERRAKRNFHRIEIAMKTKNDDQSPVFADPLWGESSVSRFSQNSISMSAVWFILLSILQVNIQWMDILEAINISDIEFVYLLLGVARMFLEWAVYVVSACHFICNLRY